MPMKIATRTTVLSQMLVFRSNGDAKTVALHLTRLTMWGYHRVCSTMMGSWTSLPEFGFDENQTVALLGAHTLGK